LSLILYDFDDVIHTEQTSCKTELCCVSAVVDQYMSMRLDSAVAGSSPCGLYCQTGAGWLRWVSLSDT